MNKVKIPPIRRRVIPNLIVTDLVGVSPMRGPIEPIKYFHPVSIAEFCKKASSINLTIKIKFKYG